MPVETSLLYLENKLLSLSKVYARLRNRVLSSLKITVFRFSCPLAAVPTLIKISKNKIFLLIVKPDKTVQQDPMFGNFKVRIKSSKSID